MVQWYTNCKLMQICIRKCIRVYLLGNHTIVAAVFISDVHSRCTGTRKYDIINIMRARSSTRWPSRFGGGTSKPPSGSGQISYGAIAGQPPARRLAPKGRGSTMTIASENVPVASFHRRCRLVRARDGLPATSLPSQGTLVYGYYAIIIMH